MVLGYGKFQIIPFTFTRFDFPSNKVIRIYACEIVPTRLRAKACALQQVSYSSFHRNESFMCNIRACQLGRQLSGGVDCPPLSPCIPKRAVLLIWCSDELRYAGVSFLYARNQGQKSGGDRGSFRDEG